ncbi:hypothetical protein [Paenibacillus sp. FSL R7-0331]|uniref:hypothetical protein n=1 Tax=Paenibacillus sp. FSL R7-0331 TaxID=1536773 RepID=UPI0004F79069|nr:hypothetical protein [Paenibacillus sp. FSL R7-0331]AIQ54525.1 hypothetical protein R70331_25380 [Paenibacillus sp. FSL R7-0331]
MSNDQWPPPIDNATVQEWKQRIKELEEWSAALPDREETHGMDIDDYAKSLTGQLYMAAVLQGDPTTMSLARKYMIMGFDQQMAQPEPRDPVAELRQGMLIVGEYLSSLLQPLIGYAQELSKSLQEFAEFAASLRTEYRSWRPNEQGYLKYPFDRWRDQLGRNTRHYKQFRSHQRKNAHRHIATYPGSQRRPNARHCLPDRNRSLHHQFVLKKKHCGI